MSISFLGGAAKLAQAQALMGAAAMATVIEPKQTSTISYTTVSTLTRAERKTRQKKNRMQSKSRSINRKR